MRFYANNILKNTTATKKGKTLQEIEAIEKDIEFMKSMISDRRATYSRTKKLATEHILQRTTP